MINYTERLTLLMRDIVSRIPALSFIDVADVLVFARHGRSNADGAFATCHCLTLPPSEPGYYFWHDRSTGRVTRRSEWFVTRSPVVTLGARPVKYLISFVLPRFCDQSFERSRKARFYRGVDAAWVAKLDTVVHELYHIDPGQNGIRRIDRGDSSLARGGRRAVGDFRRSNHGRDASERRSHNRRRNQRRPRAQRSTDREHAQRGRFAQRHN